MLRLDCRAGEPGIIERFIGTVRKPDDDTVAVVDDGAGGRDLASVRPVITNNPKSWSRSLHTGLTKLRHE